MKIIGVCALAGLTLCWGAQGELAALQAKFDGLARQAAGKPRATQRVAAVRMLLNCARESGTEAAALEAAARKQIAALEADLRAPQAAAGPLIFEDGAFIGMVNGKLGLLFKATDDSAELKAVYHPEKDYQFLRWQQASRPLWEVAWFKLPPPLPEKPVERDLHWGRRMPLVEGTLPSTAKARVTKRSGVENGTGQVEFRWQMSNPAVTAMVMCTLKGDEGISHWRLELDNASGKGIRNISFPLVGGIGKTAPRERDYLAVPIKQGFIFRDPAVNADLSGMWNDGSLYMQYLCYYTGSRSGLYLASENPERLWKLADLRREKGTLTAGFTFPVANMGVTSKLRFEYAGAVGAYEGDWYEGSALYRDWAVRQQWAPKQILKHRSDVPQWLKEAQVTVRANGDPKDQLPKAIRMQEYFGVPVLLNWYLWHASTNIIEHAPEYMKYGWPSMKAAIAEAKSKGMHTVVYTSLRSWDVKVDSYETEGKQAAVLDPYGNVAHGGWGGIDSALTAVGSDAFRKRYVKEVVDVVKSFGADGVYADLAGTFVGPADFRKGGKYPVGGGSALHDGQAETLKELRAAARKVNPDFIVMAEAGNELILDSIDTYLTYHGFKYPPKYGKVSRNVPLLSAVYGQYSKSYGGKSLGFVNGPMEAAYPAQQFVYGNMLGRFFVSEPGKDGKAQNAQDMRYWRHLARYRQAAMPWLGYGKMVRPLELHYAKAILDEDPEMDFSVETATWEAEDRSVAFVFASTRVKEEVDFSVTIDPARYGIPRDGSWKLYRMSEEGGFDGGEPITGPLKRDTRLPALRAQIWVAKR